MQRVKNVGYDDDDLFDDEDVEQYGDEAEQFSAEDRQNLATLTPVVRAELEEAGVQASDKEIQDSLWHYYWDAAKSVSYLKTTKTPKTSQPPTAKKEKSKSKFDQAAEKRAKIADTTKSQQANASGLVKKTDALNLASSPAIPAQPKIRSKGLDVPKLWEEEKAERKANSAFVVIGHVDHGKSTLMGRMLLDTGAVSQRDIDKYKKQAAELGKASFALAWVMDTGAEERERGITVDIAQHHFNTEKVDFTILDAPGHRDFVPNMIGGASMADVAVLVVDANQLESGMKGQTKEHILLAKAVGLQRVVVAVNKLDTTTPPWKEELFATVFTELLKLLKHTGFAEDAIKIVPCSGLSGANVVKSPPSSSESAWVSKSYNTLLQELESSASSQVPQELLLRPFRLQIADVFRGGITNPLSISGRISAGSIQTGEQILVQPSGETATIRAIEVSGEPREWAIAGQISTLHLADIEAKHLRVGDTACSLSHPVQVIRSFTTRIEAVASLLPQEVDVHIGRLHMPGRVSQLVMTVDGSGDVLKKKPKIVKEGQRAVVRVTLGTDAPVDVGSSVVLRSAGATVGFGVVESVGDN